jgi:hypothetical protein
MFINRCVDSVDCSYIKNREIQSQITLKIGVLKMFGDRDIYIEY